MKKICKCLKQIAVFCIICWVINAVFFFQWKNLYYYPEYELYLYIDGGIIGNRTIILGQSQDCMNTILRYDSRNVFDFYICKSDDHYYIYWPEDTTSWHYTSVKSECPNASKSYELKRVPYHPFLKYNQIDSTSVSLVTYIHQTPEDWIDTYQTWSDTIHWGSRGQLKIYYDTRIFNRSSNTGAFNSDDNITIVDCDICTYMRLLVKALDKESVIFLFSLCLFVIIFVLCHYVERDNRT